MRGLLSRLRPVDGLTLIFLSSLLSVTIFFKSKLPDGGVLISIYSALIAIQVVLILLNDRVPRPVHDIIFPLIYVIAVFDSLERLVHYVNPNDIDPILIRLDYLIFGGHPTVMLERITTPFLTDVLQLSYATYYFIPIAFGIVLKAAGREKEFQKSLFLIVFCFFLSYTGYILTPALGPRYTISHLQADELSGIFLTAPLQELLNRLEGIKRDAFPSGHAAVTLLVLLLSWRYSKKFFRIAMPVTAMLLFSTVYMRYHYAVDVIAGVGLTVITVFLGGKYYGFHERIINNRGH